MERNTIVFWLILLGIILVGGIASAEIDYVSSGGDADRWECNENLGCYLDNVCYSWGYRMDKMFCARENFTTYAQVYPWLDQYEEGENCINNFECESNLCANGVCTNLEKEINERVDAKMEEIKKELIFKAEQQINELSNQEISNNQSTSDKNLLEQFLEWLKTIFS